MQKMCTRSTIFHQDTKEMTIYLRLNSDIRQSYKRNVPWTMYNSSHNDAVINQKLSTGFQFL